MPRRTKMEQADIAVINAAAPARHTLPVRLLGWASEMADQPQLISFCTGTLLAGLATGNRRLARTGARMLAAELLATKLKGLVKHRVDRTRPHVAVDGGRYALERGHDHAPEKNSFPSGHTAGAVAVARAFARDYPERRPIAYGTAATVAAVQVPRCQHYPSDIAAGGAIGLAAELIVSGAMWMIRRHGTADHAGARPPKVRETLEIRAALPISRL